MDILWRSYKHASQDQYLLEDYSYINIVIVILYIMVLRKISIQKAVL